MLRTLEATEKSRWKDHLQKVVYAHNATISSATGYSPFFLLYGREPRLSVDTLSQNLELKRTRDYRAYVVEWQRAMQNAYQIAYLQSEKEAKKNEKLYNRKAKSSVLEENDRVLIKNLREKGGPGKLRGYYEEKVYRVVERKGEGPVYVIEPERGGERRTVHRNLLFHCSEDLPDEPLVPATPAKEKSEEHKNPVEEKEDQQITRDSDESDQSSDDETPAPRELPPRTRQKTKKLNYNQLGNPNLNHIRANLIHRNTSSHDHKLAYKRWLEQLWMIGWVTDRIVKHKSGTFSQSQCI